MMLAAVYEAAVREFARDHGGRAIKAGDGDGKHVRRGVEGMNYLYAVASDESAHAAGLAQGRSGGKGWDIERHDRDAVRLQLRRAQAIGAKTADEWLETGAIEPDRELREIALTAAYAQFANHEQNRDGLGIGHRINEAHKTEP
jgi:hypothetical protein